MFYNISTCYFIDVFKGKNMSTFDFVKIEKNEELSEFQTVAEFLMNCPVVEEPTEEELFKFVTQQQSVVLSDIKMAKNSCFDSENKFVPVNFTGESKGVSIWTEKVVNLIEDADKGMREEYNKIIREASYELMDRNLVKVSAYFSLNKEFSGLMDFLVPKDFSKQAYDFLLNFIPVNETTLKLYSKTKPLNKNKLRIVSYPDWVNDEWLYWRSRNSGIDFNMSDPEPQKSLMIYELKSNTMFLLGCRTFDEIKKAVLSTVWNISIELKKGLPVFGGSSKIDTIVKKKKTTVNFVTISDNDKDRTFFVLNSFDKYLNKKNDESVESGSDLGQLMLTEITGRKEGMVGFSKSFFIGSSDFPGNIDCKNCLVSGENTPVFKNEKNEKDIILSKAPGMASKIMIARESLGFATETQDLSLPEYFVLLMRDELLPPLVNVKDKNLFTAFYFSYISKRECINSVFLPGANPFRVWNIFDEVELFEDFIKKTRPKFIIINPGKFLDKDINDNFLASIYPKLAKDEIKWKDWKNYSGLQLPEKGIFKNIIKNYDQDFNPENLKNKEDYNSKLLLQLEKRISFLKTLGFSEKYIAPMYKILLKFL
jgi:phosphoenolpyruvate carboxykinase (ATP)